ncbi:DALR anticodon-binding domain-containing protein [Crocosphaera sp. Alani8]|uniref:DALR anticodon-binding domain-containing protein n=1 Tax=Crocosphaera sp. Alani8 TaxID=3038952 RepID=UPI00313BB8D4
MAKSRLIKSFYPIKITLNNISPQKQIEQFLFTKLSNLDLENSCNFRKSNKQISLSRLPTNQSITYRCAIAFQLSPHFTLSFAETIFNTIKQPLKTPSDLCLDFTLKLLDPGWLDFTLCDRSLFIWLQSWETFPYPQQKYPSKSKNHDNLWIIQYSYARCCALLRLGEQERLIQLKNEQFKPYLWPLLTYQSISWSNLTLNEFERSLISQLLTTVDRLINQSNVNEIKLALALSESFLNFERYCRIFGEISQQKPQLSQARLGLVAITQTLLQGLWLSQIEQPLRNRL